ncbi:MAG: polyphenol oxidase family protein [Treponema sp.]|nr:polyphenol oxidase family protein [Treponema sp.]
MIKEKNAFDFFDGKVIKIPFSLFTNDSEKNNSDFPFAFLTVKQSGSMRFRYNEINENRKNVFDSIDINIEKVIPIELIHSKTVFFLKDGTESKHKQGDGLLTCNKNLIPSVTVADCVPIYLFDPVTKCFCIVHSGWKGTGIAKVAIESAQKILNAKPENFYAIIGAHIHSCCYSVDSERANFFYNNFSKDCITQIDDKENSFALSLAKANIAVLKNAGMKEKNILHINTCTCCDDRLGSFRRETVNTALSPLNFTDANNPPKNFTPMAAFISW